MRAFSLLTGLVAVPFCLVAASTQAAEISDGRDSVSPDAVRQELRSVPENVRTQMNRDQLAGFVSNMLLDRRLAEAAKTAGTADQPEVRARIERATRDIVVRAYVDAQMAKAAASLPDVTELARERYMASLSTYAVPEAIRVSHILFTVNEEEEGRREAVVKAKATEVLKQLRGGADFAELAKEHSEDPGSKRSGGEIRGWSEKGKFVPPFEEAAYALKPGEISDVVRTRFGYHIIKLHEKREARQQTFDEVKGRIIAGLRNDMLAKKREEFIKPFQGTRPIVLDDATFEALKKP